MHPDNAVRIFTFDESDIRRFNSHHDLTRGMSIEE